MIDLHSHTIFSDGTLSPEELIDKALKKKISHLAITDHDTCQALDRAISYAHGKAIQILPGIELEVDFPAGDCHILGLNLKRWDGHLEEQLEIVRDKRSQRNKQILHKMNTMGLQMSIEEIEEQAKGVVIARPHFAKAMVKKGYAKDIKDAFNRFLGPNQPLYVKKESFTIEEAIDWIKQAGGYSVLAHPLSLYISWTRLENLLIDWKAKGLQGVEAWHSGARIVDAQRLEAMGTKIGLFITGGSDYHGKNRLGRQLGYGPGQKKIEGKWVEPLL